ncbi:MAG: nucleotidyltransferase domain-containing protein, partial [Anaerolineae bacterium]|nr:nucleotidyltransferase domain-containing protein [Anaerolineae bacterium]
MLNEQHNLLSQCRYPDVAEPFLSALKAAVRYIVGEWDVSGIIAAGSIIRGTAHATSDWDIYVVHKKPQRQMLQRYFAGVPAQIFLNPPAGIRQYFVSEAAEGVCITAHM